MLRSVVLAALPALRGFVIALAGAAWACSAGSMELSEQERAGQQIYLTGESPSGARM